MPLSNELAATESTHSATRQGRPKDGQRHKKNGLHSQTPEGTWDSSMHPLPGRCRQPFTVRVRFRETNAGTQTAERLKQSIRRNTKTLQLRNQIVSTSDTPEEGST